MLQLKIISTAILFNCISLLMFGQSVNSVRVWESNKRTQDARLIMPSSAVQDFQMTTQYSDGLNRPLQTILKQGSLSTATGTGGDMVSPHVYDEAGRERYTYLPFASSSVDGNFKTNPIQQQASFYSDPNGILKGQPETYFYGQTDFEPSPLNRISKSLLPGNNWVGNNTGIANEYDINALNEKVHIWNIEYPLGSVPSTSPTTIYGAGQLFKNITIDENGKKVIIYTDKSGNTILKKVQDKNDAASGLTGEHAGWLCTYYVYDDFGRQRFIIPPKAVVYLDTHSWVLSADVVNELCFSSEYDERGRLIVKKSPGADAIYMVYDRRDRLVFSQDGNQRHQSPKKWMATLYDNLDRPTLTGLIDYSSTREDLQNYVNNVSNNGGNDAMTVNSQTPSIQDLITETRDITVSDYKASNSITFNPGFESETGANFIAEIVTTSVAVNNTVPINGNPLPPNNNLYTLTQSFYDDYSYTGAKSFSTGFTIDNSVPADEAEAVQQSLQTIGYVTGTKVRLLDGSNTFLTTTSFYDEKGRPIQLQGDNHKGFTDEATTQYDFSGKVRSIYEVNRFDGATGITVFTKNTYDILGRVTAISKSINSSQEKTIASYSYDALGRLSNKKLAPGFAGPDGPQLESLDYTYNIQGWLTGINKEYAASNTREGHFFGMELGYDKTGTPGFTHTQTNGNIAGNAWKTRSDNIIRKYDYDYDNVNQLTGADFNQRNTSGAGWTKDKMNFTSDYGYDENGNIKTQNQWGIAPGTSPQQIDKLLYNYDMVTGGWTNRLKRIEEQAATGANGNLGDFKNGAVGSSGQQYDYDYNGNQIKDLNKEIGNAGTTGIEYNFMNLPVLITFKNTNKTIAYTYDAAGNKLRKILNEPADGSKPARHIETDYLNGFVYQNNELQFFSHEEGRVRKVQEGNFVYDYFIKDHLTNVRMILTEEQKQDIYPAATLEGTTNEGALPVEQNYYDINTGQITDNSLITNVSSYQNNNGISNPNPQGDTNANSNKMYKLSSSSQKMGLSIALKVMSGDKIDIFGKSYFYDAASSTTSLPVADILGGLLGSGAVANSGKGVTLNDLTGNSQLVGGLTSLLNNQPPGSPTNPKAYINYVILDEQFNFVSGSASRTGVAGSVKDHYSELQNISIPQNGYIYIYCSNESNINVFFDNLQVVHTRGRILEENHYYSYGLKIAGISSKAPGSLQNRYGYQGDFSEHDEETALDEFDLRHFDPQTGRWTTTDPYEQFANPYLGMGNSPVINVDPDGGCIFCETAERALTLAEVVVSGKGNSSSSFLNNLLANSREYINPIINSSLNALSKAGSGISWFSKGLWNEGVMPTVDWVNHNVNLVYGVFNGINSQFTHEDFFHGTPMTHTEGVVDAVLPFIPLGKVGGAVGKTLFKDVENIAAKTSTKLLSEGMVPNAGGNIVSFTTKETSTFFRVYSGNPNGGAFLTKVAPKSSAFAREGLALPSSNTASFIQKVTVPSGVILQRSRSLRAFGRRGGLEQFQILNYDSRIIFHPGIPLK